ncbi:efflux RND transporter periplasmic adaptor subunit [Aestuariibacter sp. A3R04]|uniref:efflux RND transporter periplasmic adaptor subunit n=1 Tax=Aestuariibacter sp. A3R04 TaxID=2841571 RepID=UPI001C0A0DCE|nr:efflux RND transporter periplasmic adaptor subunit [Aestuariibacter sp. A3R04]MBU3021389.1 efflux RND transporter periplasmic adaptor subunit [Aestuariibacter sp. A3R04]
MKNKKIIVTLLAAACIVLAIVYTAMNTGGGHPGTPPGAGEKSASTNSAENASSRGKVPGGEEGGEDGSLALRSAGKTTNGERRGDLAAKPPLQSPSTGVGSNLAKVGVYAVQTASYKASVKGYGEVQPVDSLSLVAQVGGRITILADEFKTGAIVSKNTTLAIIDDTDYLAALSSARADYEDALVALEEERLQGVQAQDEWRRSGLKGEPASALVLRQPQLKAAQAKVEKAKQALEAAKRDLAFTKVTAPFDALIVSRDVSPGSYVQTGEVVATLYSLNTAEIAVALSPAQWSQLPDVTAGEQLDWPVILTDATTQQHWIAEVSRAELHQDTSTRQRNAVVTVNKPLEQAEPLAFGSFVSAEIEGRALENVWKIPASAVSQKQEVWLVEPDTGLLQKFTPDVLFEQDGFAFITPYNNANRALVVARPLNSYLVNTAVAPLIEGVTGGAEND